LCQDALRVALATVRNLLARAQWHRQITFYGRDKHTIGTPSGSLAFHLCQKEADMNTNVPIAFLVLVATLISVPSAAQEFTWSRYTDPDVGLSVDLPTDLFSDDRGSTETLAGRTFATPDGRADVSLYSIPKRPGDTPKSFLRNHFQLPGSSVVYQRLTDRILAVSGFRGDKIWYARCNFALRRVNCVALNYPASEKLGWDAVVTRISNSLSSSRQG
jgi:hypothetical protein